MDKRDVVQRLRAAPQNAPGLRAERRRISKEIAALDRLAVLDLAYHLIDARVARFVAYELVLNHRTTLESITLPEVEKLAEGMNGWGDIDSFGCLIAGPAWRAGRIRDTVIRKWARSTDWCWRRAALVSTVPLNGEAERRLNICRMLIADRHDLVVKAMSWALRSLAKRDPESVRKFIATHRDELAARVIREVNNKLSTGRKNPVR